MTQAGPTARDMVDELSKVGKLEGFDGDESRWAEWDFNLLGYIGGFSPDLVVLMDRAKLNRTPVLMATEAAELHLQQ